MESEKSKMPEPERTTKGKRKCKADKMEYDTKEDYAKMPEPERTTKGKRKCKADKMEYDTKEDYEAHCMEEHPGGM